MHVFETDIRNKIKSHLINKFNKPILGLDERGLNEKMFEEKKKIVKDFLKNMIEKKQDPEIAKFQDVDLKVDLKYAYAEIVEEKRNKSKKKPNDDSAGLEQDEDFKVKKKDDDLCNLTFLKHVRKLKLNNHNLLFIIY